MWGKTAGLSDTSVICTGQTDQQSNYGPKRGGSLWDNIWLPKTNKVKTACCVNERASETDRERGRAGVSEKESE